MEPPVSLAAGDGLPVATPDGLALVSGAVGAVVEAVPEHAAATSAVAAMVANARHPLRKVR